MKHLYFFAFVFFSFTMATSSYGQSFNAGILAGINDSQVAGDSYSGFNKAGILVGLYSDIDIISKINLQFEINYSQKGSRKKANTDEGDTEYFLLRFDYIDILVMTIVKNLKFNFL